MVRDGPVRRWQAETVSALLDVDGLEVVLAIVDARPSGDRLRARSDLIWDLYNNRWVARRAPALQPSALPVELPETAMLRCVVERRGRWSEHFADEDLARIRAFDVDVLIRFGFGIIRGEILDVPRFGVWSFHHDDDDVVRGGPPAFWELVEGRAVTGAVLQRLTDRLDGGFVLHKGWFRTIDTSYVRNTDNVHLGATPWPARACRQLLSGDTEAWMGTKSASDAPLRRKPGNVQAGKFLGRQAGRWVTAQARALTTADQWDVGIIDAPIHRFLDPSFVPEVHWLGLGDGRNIYAADPFGVRLDGRDTILFERFDQATRRGEIWSYDLDSEDANVTTIADGQHASYPFVLEAGGRLHCIPQVSGSAPRLFTWSQGRWTPGPTIGPATPVLDPTLVQHDDRWYLFGTLPGTWSLTQLFVWWADDLSGPWVPHELNPVKTDVRSARPGGTPFVHQGRLYRPAQDGSVTYGGAVAINEITDLTARAFDERVVRVISPQADWALDAGTHTLSHFGHRTLIDAKRRHVNLAEGRAELRARLAKLRR